MYKILLHFKELGFKKNKQESIKVPKVWFYVKTFRQ